MPFMSLNDFFFVSPEEANEKIHLHVGKKNRGLKTTLDYNTEGIAIHDDLVIGIFTDDIGFYLTIEFWPDPDGFGS